MEGWKDGRMEGWRIGRMRDLENNVLPQSSRLPFFHSSILGSDLRKSRSLEGRRDGRLDRSLEGRVDGRMGKVWSHHSGRILIVAIAN
jgi:hypothetical protein